MATAPPMTDDDTLPTYEEAVCYGTPVNPYNTVLYDSLPRSRVNTGDFMTPLPSKTGAMDEDDAETALLKAELQRLKHDNMEAKKELLRKEIEAERFKQGSASNVNLISPISPAPAPQPSVSATATPYLVTNNVENNVENTTVEKDSVTGTPCCWFTVCIFVMITVTIFLIVMFS